MDRQGYERYLGLFNARDYDGVLAHFTDDCEVAFAGYCLRGKAAVREFYAFFHAHAAEAITLQRFVASADFVALEATVRLEGLRELTPQALAARGLGRLVALAPGQVVEIPQFIHYHLEGGLFRRAICTVVDPVQDEITAA